MAAILNQYKFGLVGESFDPGQIAQALNQLSPGRIDQMKRQAIEAGKYLNADTELGKLVSLYQSLYASLETAWSEKDSAN
jgi:hypothetical protein